MSVFVATATMIAKGPRSAFRLSADAQLIASAATADSVHDGVMCRDNGWYRMHLVTSLWLGLGSC
jgi:hypothetical protein